MVTSTDITVITETMRISPFYSLTIQLTIDCISYNTFHSFIIIIGIKILPDNNLNGNFVVYFLIYTISFTSVTCYNITVSKTRSRWIAETYFTVDFIL